MSERRIIYYLILTMSGVVAVAISATSYLLYAEHLKLQRERLMSTVKSQARLIEVLALRHGQQSDEPGSGTLDQIVQAQERYEPSGETEEFRLGMRGGDQIVFLLAQRGARHLPPSPVPFDSKLAEPMRRALEGKSGTLVGMDNRGVRVLAAHEPIPELGWGLVAKIDLAEVRAPFLVAGVIAGAISLLAVGIGAFLFLRLGSLVVHRLERSEARLRGIVETAVDAIVVIDEGGIVESVNPACEKLFGYRSDEVVGRNVKMLMPQPYHDEHDGYLAAYLESGDPKIIGVGREVEAQRKDGSRFPIDLAVSEVKIGNRRNFTGMIRDLTERKRAELALRESEERYRALFDSTHDMVQSIDPEGRFLFVNPAWREVLGYSQEELNVLTVYDVLHADSVSPCREHIARVLAGEELDKLDAVLVKHDGTEVQVEASVSASVAGGQITSINCFFRDITEKKKLTEKLIEQRSLAKLGELSTIVAHEVKNPLAGIIGAARMLERRLPESSDGREICAELISRAQNLNESVRDILAYARPRTPSHQTVPVRAILEDVLSLISNDPEFDRIEVSLSGPNVDLSCDVEMIKPVVLNLLVNGAQAMHGEGRLSIEVIEGDGAPNRNGYCEIHVRDEGPGIPDEHREKIFEPFFTTKGGGTGLGLAIARQIVELHGGSISVACPAAGGTQVTVRLPTDGDTRAHRGS